MGRTRHDRSTRDGRSTGDKGEGAVRRRLPDEVRSAAVRAWMAFSFTLFCLMVTVLAALGHTWLFLPSLLVTAASVLASTWGLLDVWIARQVAAQRTWGSGTATAWAGAAGAGRRPRRRRHPSPA
ncbi:LMBR1 domain-containing protein [Streptacidiphilus sp. ASG 303]|uniref:LMBR1 domain-containing protein n=1 Tax=Streptomycetaceae TaxID=2062 RepID=UPI001E40D3AE|nr:LMBR1 domain-containing protein [Streptacidiphilus sp. ASG 303]MCD0483712.1 LMBR1 domain-containing protein [Streptacidiphilus sp. ASG 303]